MKKIIHALCLSILLFSCKENTKHGLPNPQLERTNNTNISYAKGFTVQKMSSGITVIKITSPWHNAETAFTYALVPRNKQASITLNKDEFDAIITVPVKRIVVTATTHIPPLEALGAEDKLVGFPNTDFISSKKTRERINKGLVVDLGNNESLNTEKVLELRPDLIVGFGINNQNKAYETLTRAHIPVVYNGDWTEETPLGKAEWIKFFAPFFNKEKKADSIFNNVAKAYKKAMAIAQKATSKPTVLSGGLYKDVWYLSAGDSWMAKFLKDAQTNYLWKDSKGTGSLSLSWEGVYEKGGNAAFWINPSMHTSYSEMGKANPHYQQFRAFKNKKVYTNVSTVGPTGGILFYEQAAGRPDLVLNDFIHIFHPNLLPNYTPHFFKPLDK